MNWRHRIARELTYIDTGRYLLTLPYQLLLTGGMLKVILPWLTAWHLAALAPLVLFGCNVMGRAYNRFGWQKQATEVQVIENMTPLARWDLWIKCRIGKALGVSINHIPAGLPEEMQDVLASVHHPER